jgi:hypothetical protein
MVGLKERIRAIITDSLLNDIPAVKEAADSISSDQAKRKELLASYPGILLLGDWTSDEDEPRGINLEFFKGLKAALKAIHCNAFILQDIREELERRGVAVTEKDVRMRGLDNAAIIMLVDGVGRGTIGETTTICDNKNWNAKCHIFVKGTAEDQARIFKDKPYLLGFNNTLVYYDTIDELKAKIISHSERAAKNWVDERIDKE